MKRNKIFSPSLMLEGIKQTKVIGICFAIISILASCGYPFAKLISYNSPDYQTVMPHPDLAIGFGEFSLPIFIVQYLMPVVMIFLLFNFMNKRKASDFYHSIPLSRTCVYLTYTAVALIWSLVVILSSTFLSYTIYSCTPKTIINSDFIFTTIIASFILAMLTTSIALVAKGLSGTMFTNIIISAIIMFLPRVMILLYTIAVNSAVKIADVSFNSFADINNNIVFAPFIYYGKAIYEPVELFKTETLWYSAILAIIYFVVGFVLHKFRKSEAAGKSSSYKAVQLVVRILLGAIPLLMISIFFASGNQPVVEVWFIGIAVSLLAYFLYELITTKSAKKLLVAIPFYAVSVLANVVFVLLCLGARDAIINDIPQISDISSVSIVSNIYNNGYYGNDNYYQYKTQDIKLEDKELIEILQSSLVDNVQKVKDNKTLSGNNIETYSVIYHCKSGRDIKRNIYVNNNKYGYKNDSAVMSQLEKNQSYLNSVTGLPTDKEIKSITSQNDYNGIVIEEGKDIWELYKSEYNAASAEDKDILSGREYYEGIIDWAFGISGYVGVNDFTQHYLIIPEITPKTYSNLINDYMEDTIEDDTISKTSNEFKNASGFAINFTDIKNENFFSLQYFGPENKNSNVMDSSAYGDLDAYNINCYNIDEKYSPELHKIADIIINSISKKVDINKENLIRCELTSYSDLEFLFDNDGTINGFSGDSEILVVYINITDEQYNEIKSILKTISENTK